MPFSILERKNPALGLEGQSLETAFSITGYFKALAKIIEYGYDNINTPYQSSLILNSQQAQDEQQAKSLQDQKMAKQATYFALFALLEFIIQVPLVQTQGQAAEKTHSLYLEKINYSHIMSCLIKTGLLQKVIQLPNAIEISNPEEEAIIRLCMKIMISIIFKGQSSGDSKFVFSSSVVPE